MRLGGAGQLGGAAEGAGAAGPDPHGDRDGGVVDVRRASSTRRSSLTTEPALSSWSTTATTPASSPSVIDRSMKSAMTGSIRPSTLMMLTRPASPSACAGAPARADTGLARANTVPRTTANVARATARVGSLRNASASG